MQGIMRVVSWKKIFFLVLFLDYFNEFLGKLYNEEMLGNFFWIFFFGKLSLPFKRDKDTSGYGAAN